MDSGWVLPNRFEGKNLHMTRRWSFDISLQKNKQIAKLKTNRYNLNHFSMFESWAAVNFGADKHEAELEERDKQGSRTTLLNSLHVKCTTLVVGGISR